MEISVWLDSSWVTGYRVSGGMCGDRSRRLGDMELPNGWPSLRACKPHESVLAHQKIYPLHSLRLLFRACRGVCDLLIPMSVRLGHPVLRLHRREVFEFCRGDV